MVTQGQSIEAGFEYFCHKKDQGLGTWSGLEYAAGKDFGEI